MSSNVKYTKLLDDGVSTTSGPGQLWANNTNAPVCLELMADEPRRNPRFDHTREPGRNNPHWLAPNYFVLLPDGTLGKEPWLAPIPNRHGPPRPRPCPKLVIPPGGSVILPAYLTASLHLKDSGGKVIGEGWRLDAVAGPDEPEAQRKQVHPAFLPPPPKAPTFADLDDRLMQQAKGGV